MILVVIVVWGGVRWCGRMWGCRGMCVCVWVWVCVGVCVCVCVCVCV